MKRIWLLATVVALAGCGVQPSGVVDEAAAPTGVAPGVTLYFLDAHNQLRPQLRRTERLGAISEALSLLLAGPGGSGMRTGLAPTSVTRVFVDTTPGLIHLRVPLASYETTPLGLDQIVCTALGVHVQRGGARNTRVRVDLIYPTVESARPRTCPVIR